MTKPHVEETFESEIVEHLVENGYRLGHTSDYDRERALLSDDVIGFVQDTQPKRWNRLSKKLGPNAEDAFLKELAHEMDRDGSLEVLRHGLRIRGVPIDLAAFRPASGFNKKLLAKYQKNRLTVVRQLHYDPNNEKSLDLVLFLNGIPIVTAELKIEMAGQNVAHAKNQYMDDRDPRAPIFRFKQRAFVHFAVDSREVWMTTKLARRDTFFLPFNRGYQRGKGNPPVEGNHRTFYLWEQVWQRDSMLEIVGSFLSLQQQERRKPNGEKVYRETMFFPRYHQLECVRRLVDATKKNGPGKNYLIQHSTGSGKSMSIAWLCHRLQSLHDAHQQKVFDSVVVITDRLVLDKQLQETIYQIDHQEGVVKRIQQDSTELARALEAGIPIIITTLHKFPYVSEKIEELPGQNYAIVVDEAHSSQSGEMAAEMKKVLAGKLTAEEERDLEEAMEVEAGGDMDVYSTAYKAAIFRGPRPNLSFYAFTATPKYKTLQLFGHKDEVGKPAPFHLYSMKQAIEEEFILDTLENYTTYDTYYRLTKKIDEDKRFKKSEGSKAVARFLKLHPHNIAQKTEIMVEDFQRNKRALIGGKAKAMVVCSSRLQAVRYKLAFEKYITGQGYDGLGVLVAFSDTVTDPDTGQSYTEEGMNGGIKQGELPRKFDTDAFRILIVANKYQTGFDQPFLQTMYVDKRLAGVQAVQTLSRLNRTAPKKKDTFVLDFVNEPKDILESFEQFYERTTIDEDITPNKIYALKKTLDDFRIYQWEEVERVGKISFADAKKGDSKRLSSAIAPATTRFENRDDDTQDEFRAAMKNYLRMYSFMAQIEQWHDVHLEMLYVYLKVLGNVLAQERDPKEPIDIGEYADLTDIAVQVGLSGPIRPKGGGTVKGPTEVGTGQDEEEAEIGLDQLIEMFNERFGTDWGDTQEGLIGAVKDEVDEDKKMQAAAAVNDFDNYYLKAKDTIVERFLDHYSSHREMFDEMFSNTELKETLVRHLAREHYDKYGRDAG